MKRSELKAFLNEKADKYNVPGFIANDPISIPHRFQKKQDIEISGLFAAILAWGQRVTIIKKCTELLSWMDDAPYDFMLHAKEDDLKPFTEFKHRTFNGTDCLYFIYFLQTFYREHDSLEEAFIKRKYGYSDTKNALTNFYERFFSLPDYPTRTRKHIQNPAKKSACKRMNMFLRWMVRHDDRGVDFGIWKGISPAQLVCPCDLHVDRVARKLGLISRKQTDWQTAIELTEELRKFDAQDPVRYDFALFGLGIEEKF